MALTSEQLIQEATHQRLGSARRGDCEIVVGRSGNDLIAIRRPMFLRSLGETGSGRSIAIMGLAEQMIANGGSVLWVDSGLYPRVATMLRKLAAKYSVSYAASGDFADGDQAAIASLMKHGGVGHCLPAHMAPAGVHEGAAARSRIANILRVLSDSELNGWGNAPPTLIVFNQVVGAFQGRAMGLGSLPARLRGSGHSIVFSDTAIEADALDVAAHVRQYLFHRMDSAQARHVVDALRPVCTQSTGDEREALARQVTDLVDEFAVYCTNGYWILLRSAQPTLYGRG